MIGALCLMIPIISTGITGSRLTLLSYGSSIIQQVTFNYVTTINNKGIFVFNFENEDNIRMLSYDYYSNECNSTGLAIIPPIPQCSTVPSCTICIDNINYQRCDIEYRFYYDIIAPLAIITIIYLSLWIIIPLLTCLLAVIKPQGNHGLLKRYLMYSSIIGGSSVNAYCTLLNTHSGDTPIVKTQNGYSMSLNDARECVTIQYTDTRMDSNLATICYESFGMTTTLTPTYDFASSLTTSSTTLTDWTNTPNTLTTVSYVPSGSSVSSNITQGDVGTLVINNNDLCCSAQRCRTGLMCLNEVSSLQVNGVATMVYPVSSVGEIFFSISTRINGNMSTNCYSMNGNNHVKLINLNGLTFNFQSTNEYIDPVKQEDITSSTMVWDRFGMISGIDDLYYGSYPIAIDTPYDSCSTGRQRQMKRTVLVDSCGDFDTYGIIDNRQIYSQKSSYMNFNIDVVTGKIKNVYHSDYTHYLLASQSNSPTNTDRITRETALNLDIFTELMGNLQGPDYLDFLIDNVMANVANFLGLSTAYISSEYNVYEPGILRIPFSVSIVASYINECTARTSSYTDPYGYNYCMLEVYASAICYSSIILSSTPEIFSICLYTVASINFDAIIQDEPWHATIPQSTYSAMTCVLDYVSTGDRIRYLAALETTTYYATGTGCTAFTPTVSSGLTLFLSSGNGAYLLYSHFFGNFRDNLVNYRTGLTMDCNDDVSSYCEIFNVASLFKTCMANCYNVVSLTPSSGTVAPLPASTTSGMRDEATAGCGLPPTNVYTINPIKCSSYPEYRWAYSSSGTPKTNGMIPPTIVSGTCSPPMSDGCWSSFRSGNGQSAGAVTTLEWDGTLPPSGNAIDVIYSSLTKNINSQGVITLNDYQDFTSEVFIGGSKLSITVSSSYPINEENQNSATYLNLQGGTYVTGDVNGIVTFVVVATFVRPGIIPFLSSVTGSSSLQSQYCYIDFNFNCTMYVTCTDTPCSVNLNAIGTNTSINTQQVVYFNIPEACSDCNQGGATDKTDYDQIDQGCFLFCWNFSGIGGFFGALVEWGIIIFIVILGLVILCMVPNILSNVIPKKNN